MKTKIKLMFSPNILTNVFLIKLLKIKVTIFNLNMNDKIKAEQINYSIVTKSTVTPQSC